MISARIKQQPFHPVRIVTSSGESYEVRHPDLVMVGKRELIVGIASSRNPVVFENTFRIALIHITALEELPKRRSPKSNGG